MCKVPGCTQGHQNHHCKVCQNYDSTHLGKNCPQGIDLFHGTRCDSTVSIINTGLRPSASGRIGPGIYFAEEAVARNVAAHRNEGKGFAVFKARVNPNKCRTGYHPPWAGNPQFQEWCLVDQSYEIIAVVMANGVLNGDVHAPGLDFHFKGNCTIAGNITADTIYIG